MSSLLLLKLYISLFLISLWVRPVSAEIMVNAVDPLKYSEINGELLAEELGGTIEIGTAMSEISTAGIVIKNMSDENVLVKYKGIRFTGNDDLSERIDVRYIKRWYQASGAWFEHWRAKGKRKDEAVLVPELLVKDLNLIVVDKANEINYLKGVDGKLINISKRSGVSGELRKEIDSIKVQDSKALLPIGLKPGSRQEYFITFNSTGVAEGVYNGEILFDIENDVYSRPIKIEVYGFELKDTAIEHSIYYRGYLDPDGKGSVSSEGKSEEQLRAEFQNIKMHGIDTPSVYQPILKRKKWASHTRANLERSMKKYLIMRGEAGFDNNKIYYLGLTTGKGASVEYIKRMVSKYKYISGYLKDNGVKDLYIYGSDEAKGENLLKQRKLWSVLRHEGAKILVAGSDGHISLQGDITDLLVNRDPVSDKDLERMSGYGNRVFKYHDPKSGPENPEIFRYKRGLYLWQNGYHGAMDYAYQHSMGNIWNDFDHNRYRDLAFTYPTINGVIDTLAWEGYREGISDLKYLSTYSFYSGQLSDSDPQKISCDKYVESIKRKVVEDFKVFRKKLIKCIKYSYETNEIHMNWAL